MLRYNSKLHQRTLQHGQDHPTGAPNTAPVRAVGEHEFGWYLLDFNNDHVAEGTDPTNGDTDGDWMVDWFEVNDDEQDGSRGETSPIRYDSRQTT